MTTKRRVVFDKGEKPVFNMKEDTLQRYIKIIRRAGTNEPFKEAIVAFLETYNGTNKEELDVLVFALLTILVRMDDLEIKEEAYEALLLDKELFDADIDEIKRRYSELISGSFSPDPPASTGATSSTE